MLPPPSNLVPEKKRNFLNHEMSHENADLMLQKKDQNINFW